MLSHPGDETMQASALVKLRWAAVALQLAVLAVVSRGFGIALPLAPLLSGAAALVVFNFAAILLARRGRGVSVRTALIVDLCVFAWQMYWSGGPANPFVSLFVVPVALAAVWRSARTVLVTTVLAVVAYSALWLKHQPLPHVHDGFDLHVFGMWVNFLLTALVVGFFGMRVAQTMALQRERLRAARERSLRDEGVLAVATLAAGAAHALNTPLSTMTVILADLHEGWPDADPEVREELRVLAHQVDACRDAVRELVVEGQVDGHSAPVALAARIEHAVARWRLLRPAFQLNQTLAADAAAQRVTFDRGFDHLLINLLNNAADAAQANGRYDIALDVRSDEADCVIEVRDAGSGFSAFLRPFESTKPDGFGLGLALTALICERHGGRLDIESTGQGTRVRATLKWPPAESTP
jgi:two-component system, sensor histidine kinase RegB